MYVVSLSRTHFSSVHRFIINVFLLAAALSAMLCTVAIPAALRSQPEGYILLTGFEPFGGLSINASWEAVQRLAGTTVNGRRIVVLRLPVVWSKAGNLVQQAIIQYHPELVINVGQGGGSLELDAQAQNVSAAIRDNLGLLPPSNVIAPFGPAIYRTPVDLNAVGDSLKMAGFTPILRANPGDYLCNFVSYQSFAVMARVDPDVPVLFVHVPPLTSLLIRKEQMVLDNTTHALSLIVDAASQQTPGET